MPESALKLRLREDMNAARKARDRARTLLLTTLLSDVRNREIELGHELSDDEVVEVIQRAIRRRRESAELMKSRPELADRERWEAETLEAYLPQRISEDEIRVLVRGVLHQGARTAGAVMGKIMPQVKGRANGKRVNEIVQEELRTLTGSEGAGGT